MALEPPRQTSPSWWRDPLWNYFSCLNQFRQLRVGDVAFLFLLSLYHFVQKSDAMGVNVLQRIEAITEFILLRYIHETYLDAINLLYSFRDGSVDLTSPIGLCDDF